MTDNTVSPDGVPDHATGELETRLRHALVQLSDAPVAPADWGDLAGRLASSGRRRQRLLVAAAAVALAVGTAGGYFGEAAASSSTAARAPLAAGASPQTTTASGGASAAGPSRSTPNAAAPCIGVPAPAVVPSGSGVGSATHVFSRTTADGVTIRVYRLAQVALPACGPVPASRRRSPRPRGRRGDHRGRPARRRRTRPHRAPPPWRPSPSVFPRSRSSCPTTAPWGRGCSPP